MTSFAIIAEGPSDIPVLKRIVTALLARDGLEPSFSVIQPDLDAAAARGGPAPGGWQRVFGALQAGKHSRALQFNDYLILHIDTDVCEQRGFDVPRRGEGRDLEPGELAAAVRARLIAAMGEDFEPLKERILFAIAVESMECWFLPALFPEDPRRRRRTDNCLHLVNEQLRARGEQQLDSGGAKVPARYQDLSRRLYRRRKDVLAVADHNPSLGLFVEEVLSRDIVLTEDL